LGQPALRKKSWALTKEPSRATDHEWQKSGQSWRDVSIFFFCFPIMYDASVLYTTSCLREGRSDGDQRTRLLHAFLGAVGARTRRKTVFSELLRAPDSRAGRRSLCLALIDNFAAWRQRWIRGTYFGHAVIRAGLRSLA